jgi:hypothetical protein
MRVMLLELNYANDDITGFERNLRTFSTTAGFSEYQPYVLYLHGMLLEGTNMNRARGIYNQIIGDFPTSQYRILADDRLFAMRSGEQNRPGQYQAPTILPPVIPNATAIRFEDLATGTVYLQFGIFSTEERARDFVTNLSSENISTFHISKPVDDRRLFAVIQGPFQTNADALRQQRTLSDRHNTFILRAD